MAAFTTIAAVLGAAATAASATHAIESGRQQKRLASRAENNAKIEANKQMAELDDQKKKEKAMADRDAARAKQKSMAANSQGRDSTILTGGQGTSLGGVAGSADGSDGKTLLGM